MKEMHRPLTLTLPHDLVVGINDFRFCVCVWAMDLGDVI